MVEVKSGREKFANRFEKSRLINGFSEYNAEQLSNASKKKIRFGSDIRKSSAVSNAEIAFQTVDSTFNESAMLVRIVPMVSSTRNTGINPKIFAWVSINASAIV